MSDTMLKEGYLHLMKPDGGKHSIFKKWQKKWFRLHQNGDFIYFNNEQTSTQAGMIPLLQCYRVFDGAKNTQQSFSIGLEVMNDTYFLRAENGFSFNQWIKVFRMFAEVSEVEDVDPSASSEHRRFFGSSLLRKNTLDEIPQRTGSFSSTSISLTMADKAKLSKKEGWLAKTGSNNKGWNDRYFVLSQGRMTYFKSDKSDTPQGSIELFDCIRVTRSDGKKGYGFSIEIPGRVFNISAESEQEQNDWMVAIKQTLSVIHELNQAPASPRPLKSPPVDLYSTSYPAAKKAEHKFEQQGARSSSVTEASLPNQREDSVVSLLETEVDALHKKVSTLESNLRLSSEANQQLQRKLSDSNASASSDIQKLKGENSYLLSQLKQLQDSKKELETVNDSLRTQLEQSMDRALLLEEAKQEMEEVHDEEIQTYSRELGETQKRLHEIEEVAKRLEEELKVRDESQPSPKVVQKLQQSAKDFEELKKSFGKVSRERDLLKTELDLSKAQQVKQGTLTGEKEEELKWQMKMENMKKDFEYMLQQERDAAAKERAALEEKTAALEQPVSTKTELEQKLCNAHNRIKKLEEEVSSCQTEKEKALADLNAIRKWKKDNEKNQASLSRIEVSFRGKTPVSTAVSNSESSANTSTAGEVRETQAAVQDSTQQLPDHPPPKPRRPPKGIVSEYQTAHELRPKTSGFLQNLIDRLQ